ncbi:hypothetical protein Pan216_21110 [Planctomycetes bacterium Pan216]|uniref:Uncharacterized protein n=1 Tax=Kolteria novifilia TaxID=2527975 RepID=A0A518B2P2_9BACT|nr:hypothetical protein Pan216_21110 [Planctomycetes bacterium Pan216]
MAVKKKAAVKKKTAGSQKPKERLEQSEFPGMETPKPPKEVLDARDKFIQAKRDAAEAAENRGHCEQRLIEQMHKHGITKVKLDGENKFIEIEAPEKAKVKTVPKEQREHRGEQD